LPPVFLTVAVGKPRGPARCFCGVHFCCPCWQCEGLRDHPPMFSGSVGKSRWCFEIFNGEKYGKMMIKAYKSPWMYVFFFV